MSEPTTAAGRRLRDWNMATITSAALSDAILAIEAEAARSAAAPDPEGLREALGVRANEFAAAADNWDRLRTEALTTGSRSSLMGEENVPSHVTFGLRAIVWRDAADRLRVLLATPPAPSDHGLDLERLRQAIDDGIEAIDGEPWEHWDTVRLARFVAARLAPSVPPETL